MTGPKRIVRFPNPPLLLAALLLSGAGIAVSSAFAAESFDCGPGGKPNASSAKCDCSGGKVEVTIGKVSRCTTPQVKPPKAAAPSGSDQPTGSASAAPPAAPVKALVTCPADMVLIPGGSYWVGSNEAKGANVLTQVKLDAYCMDRTEVTVADYEACVQSGGCSPAPTTVTWRFDNADEMKRRANKATLKAWSAFCNAGKADKKDHPINCVDGQQAGSFCEAFDKRLPTWAEWEVAARGKEGRRFAWGNEEPNEQRACWNRFDFDKMSGQGTCPVTAHESGNTPSGLHGMTGNVWEWAATQPGDPQQIDRGGGWSNAYAQHLVATFLARNDVTRRGSNIGFRCAR